MTCGLNILLGIMCCILYLLYNMGKILTSILFKVNFKGKLEFKLVEVLFNKLKTQRTGNVFVQRKSQALPGVKVKRPGKESLKSDS